MSISFINPVQTIQPAMVVRIEWLAAAAAAVMMVLFATIKPVKTIQADIMCQIVFTGCPIDLAM